MKLIKIDNHYHVIDDSQQTNGTGCIDEFGLRITHSTQTLEGVTILNISDIEEAINGYSVEKLAEETALKNWENSDLYKDAPGICMTAINAEKVAFIKGFKACQELNKENYLKSLKTEWEIDIIENKIVLM